jgi:PTH1 family peptidyl-tRNA hydrolase
MTWIVVGLGNPGEEYVNSRHNAGRAAVEYFAKWCDVGDWREDGKAKARVTKGTVAKSLFAAILPDTYMNKSGSAVVKYVKSVKAAEKMIVVYDDLDLPIGKIKISFDRGSGGHKGVESVTRAVKTKKFTRIRIGVSGETPGGKIKKPQGEKDVEKFILGYFRDAEKDELKKVFKKVSEALATTIMDGPMIAMNKFN